MITNKYSNSEAQVIALTLRITTLINSLLSHKDKVVLAVSGGTSPISLYKNLSNTDLPWHKIIITLVDERLVDSLSPDSNEKLVRDYLLQNKAKVAEFVNCDLDNELEIDIAILGMGQDGHTASIFPDCEELSDALTTLKQYIFTTPKTAKHNRISLSLNALTKIPYLLLSLSGNEKLEVLKKAQSEVNLEYPISLLLDKRKDLEAFIY